jgi:glycine oxidase
MSIAALWAGFRPVAPDEMPLLGTVAGGRIIVATGHYRNGILLGPLTGRIVRDLVTGQTPCVDLSLYRPDRACRAHYRFAARY